MSVPGDYLRQLASVPGPHCQEITGVVWAVSWRWNIRKAKFQDCLFAIEAVGVANVSFPKEEKFTFMKHDVNYIKAVARKKLGVAID